MAKLQANKEFAESILKGIEYEGKTIFEWVKLISKKDFVEVVRGRWIKRQFADEPTAFGYRCSECHLTYEVDTNYCPNCGADMRGDKNG